MSTEERHDGSLWVEEYSLYDLVLTIQKHVQAGYVVSSANDDYPQGYSGRFTVGMVLDSKDTQAVDQTSTGSALEARNSTIKPSVMQTVVPTVKSPVAASKAVVKAKKITI